MCGGAIIVYDLSPLNQKVEQSHEGDAVAVDIGDYVIAENVYLSEAVVNLQERFEFLLALFLRI